MIEEIATLLQSGHFHKQNGTYYSAPMFIFLTLDACVNHSGFYDKMWGIQTTDSFFCLFYFEIRSHISQTDDELAM